ncbi:hypothetical protein SteCoe_16855 [Stentor coeruleus]|uniref:Uncharacterized protein n=1 Tax=Stentor coeruleus TaxID=5963 RepID=A0A1R2C0B0_9CILI|nr:hypothetical protein SteCoe_16855 [Stentor coeruleus]
MKKHFDDKSRSKSIDSKSHNNSVYSILKDPSKSKLKHHRSVRFIEPEDFSSEESLESKSVCQQQSKIQILKTPVNDFFKQNSPKEPQPYKPVSGSSKLIIKNHKAKDLQYNKPDNKPKAQLHKIVVKNKRSKGYHFSASPKFEPKIINYEFRDKNFYEKLNKFIYCKPSGICKKKTGKCYESDKLNACDSSSVYIGNKSVDIVSSPSEPNSGKVYYKSLGVQNMNKGVQERIFKPQSSYLLN